MASKKTIQLTFYRVNRLTAQFSSENCILPKVSVCFHSCPIIAFSSLNPNYFLAMNKKRKTNLPLIQILTASLLFHIVLGIALGSYVLVVNFQKEEVLLEPPPQIQRIQPQKLQYKVQMQQQQQQSATPRQARIQVQAPTDISIPDISISLPNISANVAVGTGAGGASGMGLGTGGGGLELGKFSFEAFGIRASGEKIMVLVNADQQTMITDAKGSYPAYNVIKAEIASILGKIPTGFLYNIGFFNRGSTGYFSSTLAPAGPETEQKVLTWSDPINKTYEAARSGHLPNTKQRDLKLFEEHFQPIGAQARGGILGTLLDAMSMTPDTIFVITDGFEPYRPPDTPEERARRWERAGYTEQMLKDWQDANQRARQHIEAENAKRKASGKVESMVQPWTIAAQWGFKAPPANETYDHREIVDTVNAGIEYYYKQNNMEAPSINIVLFTEKGKNEKSDKRTGETVEKFKDIIRLGRSGRIKVVEGLAGVESVTGRRVE